MLIFGNFVQSIELEQALAELEDHSILREHVLVVFMNNNPSCNDHNPHRPHTFEIGVAAGTGTAVIGASSGFVLPLGPILCGLIGALIGFNIGVSAYSLYRKMKKQSRSRKQTHQVTVVIQCQEDHIRQVSDILWKYHALSVGYADNTSS